ncbi:aminotransferase class III-fold pyridoxal phosphate-dependent enzyme [Leucobacter allii]|uniref:Aminotransferase class III-fold pyridoxal phosphate-dependent enzyme n=1 Tax=Leucobacter allii TaxID=2932247 RepID=A0ABY4FMX9_9MICO|nr:aminotransferase class III-fold pyridoxal phosphate-dependent enzyme [Leucobacter allii]UOQ57643.1 aminotransferase class III-fold pyridoxal phosphate-dependent enzyme [Leucobacter allii]UOR02186.1 aminotransferase class III-fold pyridoxal phosphate-dependent enzyme [Leucobacter allii]
MSTAAWTKEQVAEADREYVIHSWSKQGGLNARPIAGASGSWFWDYDGNRILDFQSQLVNSNLGHQHPRLVNAIKEQADKLCYIGPGFAEESRAKLAQRLAEITPGDLRMSFFTTGGAAANENAIRLARHVTGRSKIVARYRSYHGATAGAISLTGDPRRWQAEPGVSGVVRMLDPYTYRCPAGHPDPCPVCSGGPHLEEILQYENPETVAAVILEPVTGTNGLIYPGENYLRSIREVCDTYGILLIFDEVMAGFGRTGELFACNHWGVVPDILITAKGLNSGYVPLGAMTVSAEISEWLHGHKFWGGLTYAGHPLACASAVASLDIMDDEDVVANAKRQGERLGAGLAELAERHESIGEIRGRGLFYGLELVRSRETREPLVPFNAVGEAAVPMQRIVKAGMAKGLYLSANFNVMRLTPPLVITGDEIDFALEILDDVLTLADEAVTV